ncbi:flagellar protein FlgN [Bacillus infantis]|uniref:flagellar protein FlgN n=1 Tax=Bacillus infantis TaxID=324767 RepID=UPI0039821579
MSAEALLESMTKLIRLHKSLSELSARKTGIIKAGDTEALSQILKEEQTHVAAIRRIENDRQKTAAALVPGKATPTISDCLEVLSLPDQEKLAGLTEELAEAILHIKEANDLNQQLLDQSLQYINVSMNLMRPQPENINYGPAAGQQNKQLPSQGLFNSKA